MRGYWSEAFDKRDTAMHLLMQQNRVDEAVVATGEDYVVELIKMFKQR